jgi:DNA-binding MarR family transcriptional regulator
MAQAHQTVGEPIVHNKTDDETIMLRLLDTVERDPSMTQRSIARELGIALGLANAYLKRCARKGLIKVSQIPTRRFAYYLTPQGFAEKSRLTANYLSHSFFFFRRAREECGGLLAEAVARGQQRLAFVGVGDLAEIAGIVAHEYPLEILGVVAASRDPIEIKAAVAKLGPVDAAIVTSLVEPQEVYAATLAAFGPDSVYAPALLRIQAGSRANVLRDAS